MTGSGSGMWQAKTELWPKPDSQCALGDFPLRVYGAVGFLTAQGPTVCGGNMGGIGDGNECYIFKEQQWKPWTKMGTPREDASVIQINPKKALIIGGYEYANMPLKTTELISSTGFEEGTSHLGPRHPPGSEFPVTINRHCSFPINATLAMVTGGFQGRYSRFSSTATWFVDLTTLTVTPGPTMKTARHSHGCSIFKHGTKSFGIVSGGWNGEWLDSTEIIELDQESPEWTEGMQDKSKIVYL